MENYIKQDKDKPYAVFKMSFAKLLYYIIICVYCGKTEIYI